MISLGIDLVAGKNRVPMPATGNTALVTFFAFISDTLAISFFNQWSSQYGKWQ
jgi:hypothetical protein